MKYLWEIIEPTRLEKIAQKIGVQIKKAFGLARNQLNKKCLLNDRHTTAGIKPIVYLLIRSTRLSAKDCALTTKQITRHKNKQNTKTADKKNY